jgi:hypothetical protein
MTIALAPVTFKGIQYKQKGGDIIDKLRSGTLPPPYKNNRRVRKLGPYTRVITELKKEGFSIAAITRIINQNGAKVVQPTVQGFVVELGIHKPKKYRSRKS